MEEMVWLGKALSDPLSVRIIACLRPRRGLTIEEMQSLLEIHRAQADRALIKLRSCGLLKTCRIGRRLLYCIRPDRVQIVEALFEVFGEEVAWDPQVSAALERLGAEKSDSYIRRANLA